MSENWKRKNSEGFWLKIPWNLLKWHSVIQSMPKAIFKYQSTDSVTGGFLLFFFFTFFSMHYCLLEWVNSPGQIKDIGLFVTGWYWLKYRLCTQRIRGYIVGSRGSLLKGMMKKTNMKQVLKNEKSVPLWKVYCFQVVNSNLL